MKISYLVSAAAILLMTGCTSDAETSAAVTSASGSVTSVTDSEIVTTTTTATKETPEPEEKKFITAEILSYTSGDLRFVYEGKEYELPFSRNKFKDEPRTMCVYEPNVSELIIGNKLGEKIIAKMTLNSDLTKIISCDVINPNGQFKQGMEFIERDGSFNIDKLYSFVRKGSKCTISNKYETLDFDLNTLRVFFKYDYPETIYPVNPHYYEFNDGQRILLDLDIDLVIENNTVVASNQKYEDIRRYDCRTCFYGTVQSYDEQSGKAVVLLNDKETLCTVPTYYNDGGEIKKDAEIMITLMAKPDLFGSGGTHEFDYAVISTDPGYYLTAEEFRDFSTLAYAYYPARSNLGINSTTRVSIKQAEMEREKRSS